MSTSNTETQCNGGVGYHRPDHYVASAAVADDKENGYSKTVSSRCDDCDREEEIGFKRKFQSQSCKRKWTPREKYILTICGLLFLACVAFIVIAFIRDCPCYHRTSPFIHTIYSSHADGHPSLTLICNTTQSAYQSIESTSFRWLLPDGSARYGRILVIDNVTLQHSGKYVCITKQTIDGEKMSASSSTLITADNLLPKPEICLTKNCIKTAAQLIHSMNPTVDPCDNFFEYACGNWNKKNVIPEDKSSYNTFEKLHDELQITLKGLLEDQPQHYDSAATLKAKTLYQSCMNISQIEYVGDEPLRRVLINLGRWPVIDSRWSESGHVLEDILGDMRGIYNAPILIDTWIGADDKNSSVNIIQLDEPALGLPSREYYLHDLDSPPLRAYLKYMSDVAALMGADPNTVKDEMRKVLEFETMLANASKPQNEKHDTGARYKKMSISELQSRIPGFDWLRYFNKFLPLTIDGNEEIVIFSPEYIADMVKLTLKTDKRVISNFIIWRLILGFTPELTADVQDIRHEYRKVLQGVMKEKPRWQKCVEYLNERLGVATGAMFVHEHFRKQSKDTICVEYLNERFGVATSAMFVHEHFRKQSKDTALEMIHNIRQAFNDLLVENEWMDMETRAVAREKANAIKERIGYPDYIIVPELLDRKLETVSIYKEKAKAIKERIGYPDYIIVPELLDRKLETLNFDANQYFENILKVEKYDANRTFAKFRKLVNKDEWEQDSAIVNAFYNPNTNYIVFPAGMLQPPFYSEFFPKSLNYGGIGVVIGHEITHGFDDKGRQYDKDGNLKQWWKNETIERFRKQTECIIQQYSDVQLEQIGKNIDGKNTQGENIADNGGLKQAYRAYKMWEKQNGEESLLPGLDLSHDQLFFLNFAQIWCGKMRDEEALQKLRSSVHSPGPVRAQVPLKNSEDFSRAFSCPLGSPMNPVHKCSVW